MGDGGKQCTPSELGNLTITHLTMIHAVTLGTRTGSVVGGVNPFYIWNTAPATRQIDIEMYLEKPPFYTAITL